MENKNNKQKKTVNMISVFLYSFALILFEYLLLDLFLTQKNVLEYKMNLTLGVILTLTFIGLITVIYMSDKFSKFKEIVKSSKINNAAMIASTIAIVILSNRYLNITLLELSILPIIGILFLMVITGRILEKKKKRFQ